MRPQRLHLLTETIYDAAVDPTAWAQVMGMLKENFSTTAETFYFLNFDNNTMKSVHVEGIPDRYLRSFSNRYFTPDNPWIRAKPLHRPGVVRTDQRLGAYFGDPRILRKSEYYNDWMRPQQLEHTLGTTLLSEGGIIANMTLLRPADAGFYRAAEVRTFERVCSHLRRALGIAMRIDGATAQRHTTLEAFNCLPCAIVFLDVRGRVVCCNSAGETLLRQRDGLTVRHGQLVALDAAEERKLQLFLRCFKLDEATGAALAPASITIDRADGLAPFAVRGIKLSAQRSMFLTSQPTIMLMISDPAAQRPTDIEALRQRYRLTGAEARLATALLTGVNLKDAADAAGMTYETGRWYLKILFQKTQTHRQSELVARLLMDGAALSAMPKGSRTASGR